MKNWVTICILFLTIQLQADTTSGLQGWWRLEERSGTTASDSSGQNQHATLVNGAVWADGKVGTSSVDLDGVNDYLQVTNFRALNGANAATISLWVYARATDRPIISQWNASRLFEFDSFQTGMRIFWRYGGSNGGGSTIAYNTPPGTFRLNAWQHLVFVYNNPTASTYVDGVLVGSASGTGGPLNTNVTESLRMGWNNLPAYMNGRVDEVRVYNRALNLSDIQELYQDNGGPPPVGDTNAPVVSVTSPASGSTVAGTITLSGSASDNTGVAGVRFLLNGTNLGSEDTNAPYSVAWNTLTSSNGTHTLTAIARDAAGNQSTSAPVSVVVSNAAADTTAPLVSNGSPSGNLPAGTRQVTFSVTTDENATCRYASAAGVAFASMTSAFSTTGATTHSTTVTGLADGQTYNFYIRAQDAAGNASTVDYRITFSVEAGNSSSNITAGLVGWWMFDEGSGTTAADASGSNRHGSLVNGPVWAAGRVGPGALSLDGTNDYAQVTNFNALSGSASGTISLWIYPRSTGRAIISQWNNSRLVELDSSQTSFRVYWQYGGSNGGGSTLTFLTAPNSLRLNEWQHVVLVYNNPAATAYVNGSLVGSATGNGGLLNSGVNEPLRIGWNNMPSHFNGMVDEVRVYNRALSPSEVGQLYAYNGGSPPLNDTNAPSVVITAPASGTVVSGTVAVSASASDDRGVSGVQFRLNGSNLGAEDMAAPYSVSWNTVSVANGTHSLSAVARDAAGNQRTSALVTVTVSNAPPQDTTPPMLSNGSPFGTLPAGTTQVTLSLSSSENATCRYGTSPGISFGSMTGSFNNTGATAHSTTISGLVNGQSYTFYIRAQDAAGNVTTGDYLISFSVASGSGSGPSMVIDHTAIQLFNQIPDSYVELIKSRRMVAAYLGGSHARQMHYGLQLLAAQNSRYAAGVAYNPASFPNVNSIRDLTGKFTVQYNSWSDTGGADNYWLNASARMSLSNSMRQAQTTLGYPVSVSLYGWSYHMANPAYSTDVIGHPFSDSDLQLYLDTLAAFNSDPTLNSTKFVYHTSVTDSGSLSTDTSYNLNRWNDMIRQAASSNRGILFDQADIEAWNGANTARYPEVDYAGRTVYRRHPDYQEPSQGGPGPDTYTGDHANDAIEIRKAKALWVLMARLAGWDGVSQQAAQGSLALTSLEASTSTTPEVRLSSGMIDGALAIHFNSEAGRRYTLEFSDDLKTWHQALPVLTGTGGRLQTPVNPAERSLSQSAPVSQRFYRVVIKP